MKTIKDLVDSFQKYDDRTAVIHNGDSYSYEQIFQKIKATGCSLLENGINKGAVVFIISQSKLHLLIALYASMYTGTIAVPVAEDINSIEINRLIEHMGASCLLYFNLKNKEILINKKMPIENFVKKTDNNYAFPNTVKNDSAMLLLTSGTTGKRKATELTHANLIDTSLYINQFMEVEESLVEYICIPIYHSFGFARTRCVFMTGGTVILDDGLFNPVLAARSMIKNKVNAFSGVPANIAMLINFRSKDFNRLGEIIKYVEIGSAPMKIDHKNFLIENLPLAAICMHYGLTEASRTSLINFRKEKEKLSSVGKPSPSVSVKIVDEEGKEKQSNEIGEIIIKGPNIAKGYYNDPDLTLKKFTVDGWFKTGDSGYLDDGGYLYFKGRNDELINYGGIKISPTEIENLIALSKHVPRSYCIVGIIDETDIHGEVPALIATGENYGPKDFETLLSELRDFKVSEKFLPKKFITIKNIPKTHNGKIQRNIIKEIIYSNL